MPAPSAASPDSASLVLGQAPDAAQQRGQVFAVDVLHRDEVPPLEVADVVDATDAGVGHLERGAGLVEEPPQPIRVPLQLPR